MTGDTMQARPKFRQRWCFSPTFLAISSCLPAPACSSRHLHLLSASRHAKLQADVTTATMLFTMVEALEAAKAPLQHVYFSQGIKYYVRAHTEDCCVLMWLQLRAGNSACHNPAREA